MNNEHILLVEENEALAEMLTRTLTRSGYSVSLARNGVSAMTLPEDESVDLVLLDRRLSVVDGAETSLRLKEGRSTYYLPILLMVPGGDGLRGESPDLFGADAYIEVPADTHALLRKVRDVLDAGRVHEEARSLFRSRISRDVEDLVEEIVRSTFQDKAEQMLEELSRGLVDLLDTKAREGLERLVEETTGEAFEQRLALAVQDVTRPVVEEIANEIVTRLSADVIEDRSEQMIAKFENEDLPTAVQACLSRELENRKDAIVAALVDQGREAVVAELRQNLPSLSERMVIRAIPSALEQALPELLESQVASRVEADIRSRAPRIVEQEILEGLREFGRRRLYRLFAVALGVSVAALAAAVALLIRFLPGILG